MGHPSFPDLSRKVFSFSLLSNSRFLVDVFYQIEEVPLYFSFAERFFFF